MKIVDPGHTYDLQTLDGNGSPVVLKFVKREGKKYPGNKGIQAGTTLQEALRACVDRTLYPHRQIPDARNVEVIAYLQKAIHELENRATDRTSQGCPLIERSVFWESLSMVSSCRL